MKFLPFVLFLLISFISIEGNKWYCRPEIQKKVKETITECCEQNAGKEGEELKDGFIACGKKKIEESGRGKHEKIQQRFEERVRSSQLTAEDCKDGGRIIVDKFEAYCSEK
ncbi:uncharacterized protein LOC111640031 [Centruroides sculpturatus]|uniref:uncharacterized protein LOC111640031 n=1 Tax=Centruroides sculpturatus TaxID=218467 RepID=UPI000C6EF1D7|nr:uncharacterized protein LOC111640031 [Centruroides sculpturatus]